MLPRCFLFRRLGDGSVVQKSLLGRAIAIFACSLVAIGAICLPGQAQFREIMIEVPVYSSSTYNTLLMQAESLISRTIRQQFSQDSSLASLQVTVVGTRYGETIPIMATSVSRAQWQQQPQVAQWTTYNSLAQTLFARFEEPESGAQVVAVQPSPSISSSYSTVDPVLQVEEAFQEGRISRQEYQELTDALD